MTAQNPNRIPVNIEDEMRRSYMDYAMSVIIGRALPDIRDGLKPAHRRVLYGMKTMGLSSTRGYRKCAKIVGDVMGNFHPHGDASIYDTLVRMAQDFNMRSPLIDGQGNFGSIDGDPPAAMRYTEARLDSLGDEMMTDLDKERLIERIADLVREKTIEGISDIRDESDRDGMRIVIELKRGEMSDVILNNLYKHTALQTSFGIIT